MPKIENTKPISILPSITKVFEVVIFGNLEDIAYRQGYISRNQRGFTKKMNTISNINDLLDFCQEVKLKKRAWKWSIVLIFIDLHRAYDSVDRNILLNILKTARIPGKIIVIIKVMFSKLSITFDESQSWTTTKGLIQRYDCHQCYSISI